MSPRRSSRARTTQPPPGVATAPSVTSSSGSSSRTDRAGRTGNKQASPQKSLTPHSLSSEEPEEAPLDSQIEPPITRRRTREQDNDEDDMAKLEEELDDDMAEEDEVTRCVCGYQEYPGMPSDAIKSSSVPADPDVQGDDLGGLFIQCDICKVWQHGGCVGIMQEEASPDEYFCEECRKDLHKVMTSPKGCVPLPFTIPSRIALLLLWAPTAHHPQWARRRSATPPNILRESTLTLPSQPKILTLPPGV
jgi:hypothetical protein